MPKPAFIVEGHMEQLVVQKLCPDTPVQRLEANGDQTEISAIVDRIEAIYRILNNRFYPICVVFDREGRDETCDQIKVAVEVELVARNLDVGQFRIGVCDRMIENWLLADFDLLNRRYSYTANVEFEGTNGKASLSRICDKVERYRETTVGVKLALEMNVGVVYQNSPSFRALVDQVDFECRWLRSLQSNLFPE